MKNGYKFSYLLDEYEYTVFAQPEELRSNCDFISSNGIGIYSVSYPELDGESIYIRGRARDEDNRIQRNHNSRKFNRRKAALIEFQRYVEKGVNESEERI